jgi:uncharacterized protein (DUF2062 family)
MPGRVSEFIHRRVISRILHINDTPHAIALGTAIGMFLAMTPTVGIQIILAATICTVIRANRVAAVIMVFISNPLTMVPIYWLSYGLGAAITGDVMVSHQDFAAIWQHIRDAGMIGGIREALVVLTGEIFVPMLIGGSLLGLVFAVPLYPVTKRAARGHRRRREARLAYEKLRELRAGGEVQAPAPLQSGHGLAGQEVAGRQAPSAPAEVEREELLR